MSLFDHMNLFADIATNHRGDKDTARRLIADIFDAGAIPKIQLFSDKTWHRKWSKELLTYGGRPINFVPSVFRPEDVDFIMPYKPLALKVASVEATYWKLIERCCQEDLPLIISTGGMDEKEIETLLFNIDKYTDGYIDYHEVCLMHCVSIYPTPKEQLNLGRLATLDDDCIGITIGWSSHCPVVDPAAFALAWAWGATQFEVHVRQPIEGQVFWMAKNPGPDGPEWMPEREMTLDEQCAFTPYGLKQIRSILEDLPVLEGSDDYAGPDRPAVLEWRKRWQT